MRIIIIFIILLFQTSVLISQRFDNLVKVIVTGTSYMGDKDTIEIAKKRAEEDAERKAIEQGTGIYLESFTKTDMFKLVTDEIRSWASGYIFNKTIISEWLDGNERKYFVKLEAEVKCGDLINLVKYKNNEYKEHLTVDLSIVSEKKLQDGTIQEILVRDRSTLFSHDRIKIYLRPHQDCYVYIFLFNSQGDVVVLYPDNYKSIIKFIKGKEYTLPNKGIIWALDEQKGIENLYFLSSYERLVDIDWILEKISQKDHTKIMTDVNDLKRSIMTRGIAKIEVKDIDDFVNKGNKDRLIYDLLSGYGEFVRMVKIIHK